MDPVRHSDPVTRCCSETARRGRRTPMTSHDDQRGSARRTVALQRTEVGTDEGHRPRRGDTYRRRWWTLAILSVSLLIIIIDDTIINVAVPTLQRELGASASALQWILDAYIVVFAGLLLTMGSLGDRFGRKRALQIGLLVFAGASVLGAYAGSASQLIAARALMGVGGALIMPSTLSVITDVFPRGERVKAIGIWTGIASLGIPLGPIVGGWLLENFWWGSVFLLNVPIAIAALAGGWILVPESRHPAPPRPDLPGLALSVVALTSLVYGIIEAPSSGWMSAAVIGSLGLAVLAGATFVLHEARAREPMLDLRLFRNPRLAWGTVAMTLAGLAIGGLAFLLTQYLQFVQGYTPLQAGLRSAINDSGRQVGAALGIGILGALANAGYRSGIGGTVASLSPDLAAVAKRSVGAALEIAAGVGGPAGASLRGAASAAFMDGFGLAMLAGAVLLAAGAVAVLRWLPPHDVPARPEQAPSRLQPIGGPSPDGATHQQRPGRGAGPEAATGVPPVGSVTAPGGEGR